MKSLYIVILFIASFLSCTNKSQSSNNQGNQISEVKMSENLDSATFGGGCFWCVEAVFLELNGVEKVVSGYSGGNTENPTYKEVCSGNTGHAEVCRIYFDKSKISFSELLLAFFSSHDPTTLNKQGNDIGTQYRSVIYYNDEEQKNESVNFINKLTQEKVFENKIVTEVSPSSKFFPAEDYHQNYYNQNPNQGYCSFVIAPKLEKFKKAFKDKLKTKH